MTSGTLKEGQRIHNIIPKSSSWYLDVGMSTKYVLFLDEDAKMKEGSLIIQVQPVIIQRRFAKRLLLKDRSAQLYCTRQPVIELLLISQRLSDYKSLKR